ncbi:MAG: T9SS type A sorting domain-containing protein [Flavobacteriaceae bacterium]|nr:T9SS type A sorting domain-containing protein [Flavobacteriaceae bacterium]
MRLLLLQACSFLFSASVLSQITITTHITQTHLGGAFLIHNIDTDSSGDADFISVSRYGAGEFPFDESIRSETLRIPTEHLYALLAVDLDGDQDLDIVTGEKQAGAIQWHQNAEGEFTTHTIQSGPFQADLLTNMDADSDGDQDIMAVSFASNLVTWFENDGSGNFVTNNQHSINTEDWNKDGTTDEINMIYFDISVSWFRSEEQLSTYDATIWEFGNERWFLSNKRDKSAQNNTHITSYQTNAKLYFKQQETFLTHTLRTEDSKITISTLDENLDGQKEALTAYFTDNLSRTWNNLQGSKPKGPSFYPNPPEDFLFVQRQREVQSQYMIYDMHGRQVDQQIKAGSLHTLDVSNLSSGIYFITTQDKNETILFRMIKK